jgi:hypothetical protein
MQRLAHSGGSKGTGVKQYDFDGLTSGAELVEKVLVHIKRPERE